MGYRGLILSVASIAMNGSIGFLAMEWCHKNQASAVPVIIAVLSWAVLSSGLLRTYIDRENL